MRRRVLFLVLAGCTPSRAPSPVVDASPVVVATVSAAPSSSAAPANVAVEPNDEIEEIALAMCAATYREEDGKRIVGCRKPPPFSGKGRASDGKLVRFADDDLTTFCAITLGVRGAFSAPSVKEVLVTVSNCRDDTDEGWNGSMPGSAAVVGRDGDRWTTRGTTREVNTGDCLVMRRKDGHDMLMCRSRYDAGSIGTDHYFFMLDFAREKPLAKTVAHLFDDVENWMCPAHDGQGKLADTGITGLRIAAVSTADLNGDGATDLVIDVERAHAEPSAKLEARLRTLCNDKKPIAEALPPPVKHRLEIVSDAKAFRATPATRKLLDKWRAESPAVTQLEAAAPPKLED